MITINTAKGLIKVETWEDIQSRFGFVKNLNPKEHELDSIIGRYVFPEKAHCGLSHCHRPHARGYIVATKDGHETNIGKDCGKRIFGVEFELLARKFDRDMAEKENREILWSFHSQVAGLEANISALRRAEKGADWVHKNTQILLNRSLKCPSEVVHQLTAMAKNKSNILSKQHEATESEIKDLEAIQLKRLRRPYYVNEELAEIAGIEALYSENDIRSLVIFELEQKLKQFKMTNIDLMTFEELSKWKKWTSSTTITMQKAIDAVEYGRRLLIPTNLEPLLKVITLGPDRILFRSFIESLKERVKV